MLISKEDIDEVKARHELSAFITDAGVKLKPVGKYLTGLCLFHDDHNASLVVDKKKQIWNCLGACSANGNAGGGKGSSGGDLFAFAMKLWGVDFREAFKRLGGVVRDEIPPPRTRHRLNGADHGGPRPAGVDVSPTSRAPRTEVASRVVEHMVKELAQQRRAREYLESRGLRTPALWRAFKLGYSSGSVADLAGTQETSEVRRLLVELGILTEAGHERMKGRVVFPLVAFNQLPVGLYGRAIDEAREPHHLFLPGPRRGLFNWNAVRRSKELLVVESVIDALSLIEAGVGNAVPLYGINGLTDDHKDLVKRCLGNVVVALDADEAGRKATPQVVAAFEVLGVKTRAIEWPEKDPNELLVRHGPAKTREIAEKLLASPRPRDAASASGSAPASDAPAVDVGDFPTVNGAANPLPLIADPAPDERRPAVRKEEQQAPDGPDPEPPDAPDPGPGSARSPEPSEAPGAAAEKAGETAPDAETAAELTLAKPAPDEASHPAAPESSAPPAAASSASTSAHASAPPRPTNAELLAPGLTLNYDDRLWDVAWQNGPEGQLRAHVKVFLGAAEVPAFLDSLNLRSSRSRDGFAKKAASLALPLEATAREQQQLLRLLDSDLLRIAELGEERRKTAERKSDERPGTLTEERRLRAMAYAKAPHLLARVVDDIGAAGYVGEPTIKALSYLVSVSRKLPEALSMVILSSSGSGKSALAEVLEKLTPEEDLVVVTRFTASSLYWMPRDALKRKFISIEERSGSQEADYSIRALQSKRKVTMMAPIKDQATGQLETKFFEVEGPASFLESTTESQIHHENATRCFEVRLDESREQTLRIQDAQRFAKTLEGHRAKGRGQEIAALHQDVQRLLRPVRVVIPYAAAIEFPTESIRTRRDNPRFLNLIEALAFLHQYQRPLTVFESGAPSARPLEELSDDELDTVRVEATLDDYAMAYELASDLLYETLAELKRPLRVFMSAIRELAKEKSRRREP